jgi:hypothetical protein
MMEVSSAYIVNILLVISLGTYGITTLVGVKLRSSYHYIGKDAVDKIVLGFFNVFVSLVAILFILF